MFIYGPVKSMFVVTGRNLSVKAVNQRRPCSGASRQGAIRPTLLAIAVAPSAVS